MKSCFWNKWANKRKNQIKSLIWFDFLQPLETRTRIELQVRLARHKADRTNLHLILLNLINSDLVSNFSDDRQVDSFLILIFCLKKEKKWKKKSLNNCCTNEKERRKGKKEMCSTWSQTLNWSHLKRNSRQKWFCSDDFGKRKKKIDQID